MDQGEVEAKIWKATLAKLEAEQLKAEYKAEKARVELETAKLIQRWTQDCVGKDKNPLVN